MPPKPTPAGNASKEQKQLSQWITAVQQERFANAQQLLTLVSKHFEFQQSNQANANVILNNVAPELAGLSKAQRKRFRKREREAQLAALKTEITNKLNFMTKLIPDKEMTFTVDEASVPVLSGMLYDLAVQFRTEICLLQMLMDSETPQNSNVVPKNEFIVAELSLSNNSPITKEAFQFMRTVITNSIEKYQKSKKLTPKFYCMSHNNTYINILCEDAFSFGCLQDCVKRMSTLGCVSLYPLRASAGRLYCYSVIYSGVITEPMNFLDQIRLHIPKMRTDHWIVASSKVCIEATTETQFLFLVDELSSLALEYQYRNRLFICMEEALFHNHGQLPNFF